MIGPTWRCAPFSSLDAHTLHAILKVRVDVFVVEQRCIYPEVDGLDLDSLHLWAEERGQISAYARLLPPRVRFAEPSIGRVLTADHARGRGLGRELMARALQEASLRWPGRDVRIVAQAHLRDFYATLGFAAVAPPHDEDGILHVEMLRRA